MITANKDSLQLWCTQVQLNDELEQGFLSASELTRFHRIKRKRKKQEYLMSRALMRTACSSYFNIASNTLLFIEKPHALPMISPLPKGYYYSLSHSKGLIYFAISNNPIGIDVEQHLHRTDIIGAAEFFMSANELKNLMSLKSTALNYFYRLWCAKEAYFKSVPPSQQQHISLQAIDYHSLCDNNINATLFEKELQHHQLAVFCRKHYSNFTINTLTREQFVI